MTTTLMMIQWVSKTSRLQAFLLLSCLVLLVESFVGPAASTTTTSASTTDHHYHPYRRSGSAIAFHSDQQRPDEDVSWNSTAMAMNAAADMAALTASTMSEQDTSAVTASTTTSSSTATLIEEDVVVITTTTTTKQEQERRSAKFEPTVSHRNLDHWFHVLGGMEEERLNTNSRRWPWQRGEQQPPPPPSPSTPPPPPPNDSNKPTDHWML